jgi:1-deoxy-D-xylulose-5-phosphate synthase
MILEKIQSPQDLKKLTSNELVQLCVEIRSRMIEVVSRTGGHLASSLGCVELTVALHYCLNAPNDKIVFDVGHQAYCHKLLTGRNQAFDTLRQFEGLSGFPCRGESRCDPFTTGHSSNAVSLALGLVCARDLLKPADRFRCVAVIGDGSLSGGLCFEGLNNAGHLKKDMVVVLNTNELSIAPNTGALSTYLNKIISLPLYNRYKESFANFVKLHVPKGSELVRLADKFEEGVKGLFVPGVFFEELGFRYFGPFDGHNLPVLIPALKKILEIKGPRLVHVITKKGKGYPPAEKDPIRFHGIGPFDCVTGAALREAPALTFTDVFGNAMAAAGKDEKVVAITAAMPEGTGLNKFRDLYPERFFDVGIAEGHAVCFAAGLAAAGFKPVVAIYSTFLQRAYDQLMQEIGLQKSPCLICVDRAGIVGEDGATHQGIFDIAYLRSVPGLSIMAPADGRELEQMITLGLSCGKPAAIRYPRACVSESPLDGAPVEFGKASIVQDTGKAFCLVAVGSMVAQAVEAGKILDAQGYKGVVVNARFVRPLDEKLLKDAASRVQYIFTLEEGIVDGGFGCAVEDLLAKPVIKIGLPVKFIPHGKRDFLLEKYGLSAKQVAEWIHTVLGDGKNNHK